MSDVGHTPRINPESLSYFESRWDSNEPLAIESASMITDILMRLHFHSDIPHTPFHIINRDLQEKVKRTPRLFVATEGDQVRGALITAKSMFWPSPTEIEWFAVDTEFTDSGIGSKLIKFTEKSLYESCVRRVKLRPTMGARFFYTKHGYRYDDTKDGGYFYMSKRLNRQTKK